MPPALAASSLPAEHESRCFLTALLEVVERHSAREAVITDGNVSVSYGELYEQASSLAKTFRAHGVVKGDLVALAVEKSPEYIVALLASWMAGAAFLPLDLAQPLARRQYILHEAKPALLVSGKALNVEVLAHPARYAKNLAYVIYTSGSSGVPKGVMVPHDGLMHCLGAQLQMFGLHQDSRVLFYLSTAFDASLSDIGTALLSGASLHIESMPRIELAKRLPEVLRARGITHMDIPPSLLAHLKVEEMPDSLQTVLIGGEVCAPNVVRNWAKRVRLINIYGPTEATICTSMKRCGEDWEEANIGAPIPGMQYKIVDGDLQQVASGEEGELCISGDGLAIGYINNSELTSAKFVQLLGARYYRTGDKVKRNADGDFIYLGRLDRQVKLHGQLVAPEEIEAALRSCKSVKDAAVTMQHTVGRATLVAFVEAAVPSATSAVIRHELKQCVPSWMLPRVVLQDALARGTSGKIDYLALSQDMPAKASDASVPGKHADIVQRVWKEVLELQELPALYADFFDDLGGDSMAALSMVLALETQGIPFPVSLVCELRTIADIAGWLESHSPAADMMPASLLKREAMEGFESIKTQLPVLQATASTGTVLLTGATGFLGFHVLKELLRHTSHTIRCIMRSGGKERLESTAAYYCLPFAADELQRIEIIPGNLAQSRFGWDEACWAEASQSIDAIYHCGAVVNMLASYESLKAVNLDSVQNALQLMAGSAKAVYAASSLSVFVATDRADGVCLEEDDLESTQEVYGGYAQSKWAADYLLRAASAHMSATSMRFGLLTGHSETGISAPHDYLNLFMRGLIALAAVPEINQTLELDVTPIDYAARAMVQLAKAAEENCYHIAGRGRFSLKQIVRVLRGAGHEIKEVPLETWQSMTPKNPEAAAAHLALCRALGIAGFKRHRAMDLFQASGVTFSQSRSEQVLRASGILCPDADDALLARYVGAMTHD